MVISIEPGIYQADMGGYRHSDTILITADSYELLSFAPGVDEPLVVPRGGLKKKTIGCLVNRALGV